MCKKLLFFLALVFLLSSNTIIAQSKTVSGTITDTNNVPLAGVSVILEGTSTGAASDFDGNYSIQIPDNGTLQYSYIGFITQTINTEGRTVINVTLQEDVSQLNEVVVTALGIEKEKKVLAYAAQEVESEQLTTAANGNINTALQGKVAGVNIVTNGGVGGNARLDIRGASSLTGNDQVLWVIDGVPFSGGETSDARDGFGGISNGGGLLDINPDDVESVSVLKGGQASALYGSRGANGVVLITTKSGKNTKGLGISYTGATTFSSAAYFLDLQNEYGQGNLGVYDPRSRSSWGPRFDGVERPAWTGENLPYEAESNPIDDFTRTAVNQRHALSLSSSGEKGNFRTSILSDKNEGIYKNNQIEKLNFDIKADYKINPWLNIDTKVSYFRTQGAGRPEIGVYSYISQLNAVPRNIRSQDLAPGFVIVNGQHREYLFGSNLDDLTQNPNANSRNPYFVQEQFYNSDERNRMFGYMSGTIKFMDNLSLKLKYGLDFYRYESLLGRRFADNVDSNRPDYNTSETYFKEENSEFLLSYDKEVNDDLSFGLNLGGNLMKNRSQTLSSSSGLLLSENDIFLNAGNNRGTKEDFVGRNIHSLYGFLDVAFKDYLFLTATARNDWSSALPSNANSYFYPSVGLSALISEMTELPDWITYFKLRGTWAKLGKDTTPYLTNPVFETQNGIYNQVVSSTPNRLVDPNLKPEISTSVEFGMELRLLQSRLNFDITYYNELTENQVIEIPNGSGITGFPSFVTNLGAIRNKGIELIANVIPVKTADFNLGLTFNVAKNQGVIEELTTPENDGEFFRFEGNDQVRGYEGEKYGDIYGFAYERDSDGRVVVGADGLPVSTQDRVKLGNVQADLIGSIGLNIDYKAFSLNALLGTQIGGDIYSTTEQQATGAGTSLKSINLGRDPFFVDGNLADGSPNLTIVSPQAYWARVSGITEEFIYDASYLKLTELALSYNVPTKLLDKVGKDIIRKARVSLIGRNLFYFYNNLPGTVPDNSFNTTISGLAYDLSPVPVTRSVGVSLNLDF